ncbi:MAG: hypothetical protein L6Q76_01575 [Polyangiaceae bacterium]|nr:hypothetical protein [Polyangiaceae bacterium]
MRAGLPVDPAQWLALGLSIAVIPAAPWLIRPEGRRAVFLAAASLAAAALSALYILAYLRGGPRIIDATSYWLEARALAQGSLSFPVDEPAASTLGRFLVRTDTLDGARAAVIFPPGYPALLALGFLAGVPLAVGPLLAAALVITTFDLADQILAPNESTPTLARLAALFSVACAALRYHTADTMSHGLSALCFCGSLTLLFRALGSPRPLPLAAASGLLLGWLAAARPFSAVALGLVLLAALAQRSPLPLPARLRLLAALALGTLPGLVLLAAHQRAATGSWAASSQALYYALSDGPPGCFRYGFGEGIGCLGEHGDFVRTYLPHGYGPLEAAATTLRRLRMHLVDAANAEPLALLVPLGAALGVRSSSLVHAPRVRLLALALGLQIAVYAPFYFDGNYPGGGARFFADVLPLEHVLASIAVIELSRRHLPRIRLERPAALALALVLAGFAFRAGFDHAALRDREGGLPMFEPHRLEAFRTDRALFFLDTDHGFNLAFDPSRKTLDVARFRGDATDRLAWEARGRPPAFRYKFLFPSVPAERASVLIEPYSFDQLEPDSPLLFEAEQLWPARAQNDAWALPEHASGTCATGDRWLAIRALPSGSVTLSLPASAFAGHHLAPRIAVPAQAHDASVAELVLLLDDREAHRWRVVTTPSPAPACQILPSEPVPPHSRRIELRIRRSPDSPDNTLKSQNNPSPTPPFIALDHLVASPRENR